MKKVLSTMKKYWYLVAIGAFIIGVGSISAAASRAKQVVTNPKTAVGA